MKKNVIIGLILGFCLMPLSVKAAFEGEITFQVAFTGGDAKSKAQLGMMMPSSYDLLIKGNQLKANMHGGMMSLMMGEIIIDGESGSLSFDIEDETVSGVCLTRDGVIVHPMLTVQE